MSIDREVHGIVARLRGEGPVQPRRGRRPRRARLLAGGLVLLLSTPSLAQVGGGVGGFGGVGGLPAGSFGSMPVTGTGGIGGVQGGTKGSLVGDGLGGFTLYHGTERQRYAPATGGVETIPSTGGGRTSVVPMGDGTATVSGPLGTHRHFPDRPLGHPAER